MTEIQLGPCRLICGDCLDVLPGLDGIDAVVTDFPYGVEFKGKVTKRKTEHAGESAYEDTAQIIETVCVPALEICRRIAKRCAVFTGNRNIWKYPPADDIGCVFLGSGTGRSPWGFCCFNTILYYGKCPYTASGNGGRPNAYNAKGAGEDGLAEKNGHPCVKPVEWMNWTVNRASLVGETVLDPFMGSGTTGIACIRTGRKFIGIEKDATHFQTAVDRIKRELAQPMLFEPAKLHTQTPLI